MWEFCRNDQFVKNFAVITQYMYKGLIKNTKLLKNKKLAEKAERYLSFIVFYTKKMRELTMENFQYYT